jgi:hypothetical protein
MKSSSGSAALRLKAVDHDHDLVMLRNIRMEAVVNMYHLGLRATTDQLARD